MRMYAFIALVWLIGCSGNNDPVADAGITPDMSSTDTAAPTDSGRATDMSPRSDSGLLPDAATGDDGGFSEDAGLNVTDGGSDAAAVDMGAADMALPDRPVGQCHENAQCPDGPQGPTCLARVPGGNCGGCGSDADCPDGTTCTMFGVCTKDCATDEDCPLGTECTSNGCGAVACENNVCPVPLFDCGTTDNCSRIDCSDDPNICPDQTTCTNDWCVEDVALNP